MTDHVANGTIASLRSVPPALGRVLALTGFTGILLSTSGAFDTEAAAPLPRLGYWILISLISTGALEGCHRMIGRANLRRPEWQLRGLGLALLLLPLTAVAVVGCKALFGGSFSLSGFVHLLPGMTSILAALQFILTFFPQGQREEPASAAEVTDPLFESLPLPLRGARVYALEAEDHYVRVHTSAGAVLVRMRFRDAVAAVAGRPGLSPHRSWWVAQESIVAFRRSGGRATLTLAGGQQVPVSRKAAQSLGPDFGR
jgi:hypothetical protein